MSDAEFDEFLSAFNQRVRDGRLAEVEGGDVVGAMVPRENAFTDIFLEYLEDIGQTSGLERAYFEKKIGRANAKVNAYGYSEIDARLDLVVTIHREDGEAGLGTVPASEIAAAARKALHLFRSAKEPLHRAMEPSSAACDMMNYINSIYADVGAIRVIVLVCGLARKAAAVESPSDLPEVQEDVWDLERLFRAASSGLNYESFTIDVVEFLGRPLPCLSTSGGATDHSCFLAIVPGQLLHDLYQRHGATLLELNVRSFLQARGKVNKGIRNTLINDPRHFLAFNNGISLTVEEIEVVTAADGVEAIKSMRGLQIVNGGQTVASIHRAHSRDKVDLSEVKVQAKITRVAAEHLDELVPHISRFSNTQNKVNETDFSANHPFHVQLQKLSTTIWVPGETSRWFYERARGQWEVARARDGTTPSKKRLFDAKCPRNQRVDKTLLAKAVNTWRELPHVVSLGGQKNFVRFMSELPKLGTPWEPDEQYFKDAIAKVILVMLAEKVARKIGFSAYRANAVCYTVALLAYRTSGRLDLNDVWQRQGASPAVAETLRDWMPHVHGEIVTSAEGRNVTEWCKRKECWSHVQALRLNFAGNLESELAEGLRLPTVGEFSEKKGAPPRGLTADERERQALTMSCDSKQWLAIMEWGRGQGAFNDFQLSLAGTVLGYAAGGWHKVPSPKQTKHAVELIGRWELARRGDTEQS